MKQTFTCSILFNRFAVYLGCWLLSWGCPLAFAADRAPVAQLPGLSHLASSTSGTAEPVAARALTSAAARRSASPTAVVYTWSATGASASWSAPGSWTPTRTTPDPSDILQFTSSSAASTVVIDFGATQTIAGLFIGNGVTLTFSTDGSDGGTGFGRTLNITNGSANADLTLGSGSTLTVYTSSTYTANTGLTLLLGSGATATIGGHLVFDAAVPTGNNSGSSQVLRGTGAYTNAIEFVSGSVFTAQANFRGSPFSNSTTVPNSVVFRNGSRYEHIAGENPFALSQPASIVTFEPASTFSFASATSVAPSLAGRTYGNLEYNLPGRSATATTTSTGALTIAGDLLLTAGTVSINLPGGIILKGNVVMNGATLSFGSTSASTVQFAGTTAQTIGGTASSGPTFNANTTVQINNAAGLTLGQPISIPGTLQLTSGLLTTSSSTILTLASTAAINGGSATSFVNGPMRLTIGAVNTATTYNFPIGKNAVYRPLALNITSQTGTTIYQAEQFEQDGGLSFAAPLQRVSRNRFFTVTPYNTAGTTATQPTGFNGTLTMSFGTSDRVTSPTATNFVVAKRTDSSQLWATTGASTGNTSTGSVQGPLGTFYSGTLTSGSFTSFSDFALASTEADPTVNPLPVQLTSFAAARSAKGGVALAWATATELHSARFEVERSLDGQTFGSVATVAAQGSSFQAHAYTTHDKGAFLDQLYYRLRIVDLDGTAAYSPVATVAAGASGELVFAPNPAHDQLHLFTEAATAYSMRNALGQVVLAGITLAGRPTMLAVDGLAPGVYFLELPGSAGRLVRKIIKE